MEIARRDLLALSAAGAAGVAAGEAVAAPAAAGAPTGGAVHDMTATQRLALSGTDFEHPVSWEFMVTNGRNSNVWSTLPVPSH